MKCPKCGYIGFEPVDRCRNCGYEFSLVAAPQLPELPIRDHDPRREHPLDDLSLADTSAPAARPPRASARAIDRTSAGPARSGNELPLFGGPVFGDEPLITKASPPRPPLAVRRATPEVRRLRTESRMPMLEWAQDPDGGSVASPASRTDAQSWPDAHTELEPAAFAARAAAVAVDLGILLAIDAVIVYFTMQICGLTVEDFSVLPKGPLLAFLLVQNGGYLVAFTAGGQTLGKMAAGIKVVPTGSDAPLDLGRSVLRTLVWVALAVPAGLGFLTALSRDHRGLHDRLAGTRVVRASA